MSDPSDPTYRQGWDAALQAVRYWHEAQAKKLLVQSRQGRFPKRFEAEAEIHKRCAQAIVDLSPDDV